MSHPNTFHLVIASVGKTLFDDAAISATFPGTTGLFEALPNHEPLVTPLRAGTITVRTSLDTKTFAIESGVVEIANNRAIVLL